MMEDITLLSPPVLSPLQAAWLEELGLSRRFLADYLPSAVESAPPAAAPVHEPASTTAPIEVSAPATASAAAKPPNLAALLNERRPSAPVSPVTPAPQIASPVAPSATSPADLRARVESCTACALHGERNLPVLGSGPESAVDLMVIGEAPGAEDDRAGQPFRGKAGELLQAMIKAAGAGEQTQVYYTHLLKCRPLGNRAPTAEEVAACMAHLREQIALLQPRKLLVLGRVAAQALLGDVPVESLRGRLHLYEQGQAKMALVVTYHPAALLARPRHKAAAWQDLCLLQLSATTQH